MLRHMLCPISSKGKMVRPEAIPTILERIPWRKSKVRNFVTTTRQRDTLSGSVLSYTITLIASNKRRDGLLPCCSGFP